MNVQPEEEKKSGAYRIDGKTFFLTYPQCDLEKDYALLQLQRKPIIIKGYCIAKEFHVDGSPHLHVLLLLEKRKNITNHRWFDLKRLPGDNREGGKDFHGNYQTCRQPHAVYDYCTKYDTEAITNIVPSETWGMKGGAKRSEIAKKILDGMSLIDAVDMYPHLLFGYTKLKQDLQTYKEDKIVYNDVPNWLPNPWGILIPSGNHKKRHWWIHSQRPNLGKTTWAKELKEKYGASIKGNDRSYWRLNGKEPILVLDDYNESRHAISYSSLNQMADGTYEFRIFQNGVRPLDDVKFIIILSNISMREMYPKDEQYILLEARFNVRKLD